MAESECWEMDTGEEKQGGQGLVTLVRLCRLNVMKHTTLYPRHRTFGQQIQRSRLIFPWTPRRAAVNMQVGMATMTIETLKTIKIIRSTVLYIKAL